MSTDRETTRLVRSWLEAGVTALPDRVLDAVLDQVPATPQRRSWWPAGRTAQVNKYAQAAIAAAAVLVVAVVGYNLLPGTGGPGGQPTATPNPSPAPTATLLPTPAPSTSVDRTLETDMGPLFPGQYRIDDFADFTIKIAIPSGWESASVPAQVWGAGDPKSAVGWMTIDDLFTDPCDRTRGYLGVGPTVADLVQALATYPGLAVDETTEVSVSGFSGTRVELTGSDVACPQGDGEALFLTAQPGSVVRPHPLAGSELFQMTILDVAGERLVVLARVTTGSPPGTAAQVESIVDSTVIEPR